MTQISPRGRHIEQVEALVKIRGGVFLLIHLVFQCKSSLYCGADVCVSTLVKYLGTELIYLACSL